MQNITKLSASDRPRALALLREWFLDDGIEDPRLPMDKYLDKILAKEDFHAYIATENGRVVGGLTAYELPMFDKEETEMFLYEIGVSRPYRRKGIAKALIEVLKKTCAEKGINVIFVATSSDNEAARQLYANTGGEEEATSFFTYELKDRP